MRRDPAKLHNAHYDLLVIGGGINGAGIAHLAASAKIQTCLLEKGDFASGTSSKSTKLIHGGLRYLENLEFDLVREALKERSILLKAAPHLVKPLKFLIPVYKGDQRPLWMMKLGVGLYDFLSAGHRVGRRQLLSVDEIKQKIASIKVENLVGGVSYFDTQMDDARLCLESVLSAAQHGAHVFNYMEVVSFIKEMGRTVGVKVRDIFHGKNYEVYAKRIICCGGPWSNELLSLETPSSKTRVRPTKGVHIVYENLFCDDAVLITTKKDHRIFFIIPWHGHSLIGTTDTDYSGSPDDVRCEEEDIQYLFDEASRIFPSIEFSKKRIINTFAGLRPLVHRSGSPSKVSRKHVFYQSYSGVVYVMGGKYTTYRRIAEQTLTKIYGKNAAFDMNKFSLYGGGGGTPVETLVQKYGLKQPTVEYLCSVYGSKAEDVLALTQDHPGLKEPLCDFSLAIAAQAVYAAQYEFAQTVEDIIDRRISHQYRSAQLEPLKTKIKAILEEVGTKKRG